MRSFRTLTVLSLAAVLLLTAGLVSARAQGQTTLLAGFTLPSSDFDDIATTGYHFGIGYGIQLGAPLPGSPAFGVKLRAAYNRNGLEEDVDGHIAMLEALGLGQLTLPGGLFFEAGFGITNLDGEIANIALDSETDFCWAFGAGYRLPKLELEFLYHSVSVDDEGLGTDIGWNYMTASVGLRF